MRNNENEKEEMKKKKKAKKRWRVWFCGGPLDGQVSEVDYCPMKFIYKTIDETIEKHWYSVVRADEETGIIFAKYHGTGTEEELFAEVKEERREA